LSSVYFQQVSVPSASGICHLRGALVVLRHGQHAPGAGLPVKKDSKVAKEPWKFELDLRKQNAQLKDRRFLYAPMAFKGKIIPVKLTVLEYQNKDTNLYSLEAIEAVMT
jgi:hypothetical protein